MTESTSDGTPNRNIVGRTLPRIRGESLARVAYDFPADLVAKATLLMIAFQQRQQAEVNTWLPLAGELAGRYEGFAYFEVPLIGRRYRPARAFIDGGMRAGIPDPSVRATTVTAYQSVSGFLGALGLGSTDEIVVVLVDVDGVIRWSALGELTSDETVASLESVVRGIAEPS